MAKRAKRPCQALLRDPPDLPRELEKLVEQVPYGRLTTYGALACALGNAAAARWVAQYLNEQADRSPAGHRVVRADGSVGGWREVSDDEKVRRIAAEGVAVVDGRVDLDKYGYQPTADWAPLARLSELQTSLADAVLDSGLTVVPAMVGGVDVSYRGPSAVAAYALVNRASGTLAWWHAITRPVRFPYITGYLSFRELPLLLELIDEVRAAGRLAKLVFVDGNGVLHPRGAGIASHFGLVADLPTVGIGKTLLCGRVDLAGLSEGESRDVTHGDRKLGVALRPTATSRRPIFVSTGHRLSIRVAEKATRDLLFGHRLPEPLYWADRLSRREARSQ